MPRFRLPKARTVGFTLALFAALLLNGCCSCRERYAPFLEQVESNLRDDIRPKYAEALGAQGLPEDVVENRLGLVDDTADSLRRVRTGGPEAAAGETGGAQ